MNNLKPLVSIIIPTFDDWDRLQLCLTALSIQDYPSSLFEIIIVNNAQEANYPKNLPIPSNCKILHEPNPGSYAARNKGILNSRSEFIGFTDSDCIPEPNWISSAMDFFANNHEVYRVTGPVRLFKYPNGSKLAWILDSTSAFTQKYNVSKGLSVTANLFIRKNSIETIGLFNEKLFSGGDFEWNLRANNANLKIVYNPNIVVNHPARASLIEIINMYRRTLGGRFKKNTSQFKNWCLALNLILPPLGSMKAWFYENRTITNICVSFMLLWLLKIILILEALRLLLGGHECRK